MKTRKLLKKLDELLNADKRVQISRYDELHKLLRKLRKRRDVLKEKLGRTDEKESRQLLKDDLQILKLQRKKGLALLAKLNDGVES